MHTKGEQGGSLQLGQSRSQWMDVFTDHSGTA